MLKSITITSILCVILLCSSILFAQKSDQDLTKAAQNPIANMMSFPFQNNTNFKMGPDSNRTQNILNIQPVIPLMHGRIITRTIFPLIWNLNYEAESGSDFGLGDILFTAFYAPESKGITWGIGPVISFPSGSNDFGTGKWSAGLSAIVLAMPGQWVIGGLINNIWSFAGRENRADVNFFTFQPFINYNLPNFYFTFQPIITANREAESGNQWTVPVGLGVGKLIKLGGKLPVNLNASYFYNVVTPDFGPQYQVRILAAILLPASML
ncbi:MAG: transporter [Ignavibacteria bacterium]|nr:transporter [Ignavibacteria bacterium]